MSYLGWRWIGWLMGIWALLCTVLVILFVPETYHPKRESFRDDLVRLGGA